MSPMWISLPMLVVSGIVVGHVWPAMRTTDASMLAASGAADLTIRTRRTSGVPNSTVTTEVLYLKGARQRRETIARFPPQVASTPGAARTRMPSTVLQCDLRRQLLLNNEARMYAYMPIESSAGYLRRLRLLWFGLAAARHGQSEETGGDVTITIDSVDTGERRQVGGYVARRVITTTTAEAGPGTTARVNESQVDGWYVDLPLLNCRSGEGSAEALAFLSVQPAGAPRDRVYVKRLGTATRGYPIEETSRSRRDGGSIASRLELIEFSDATLDDGLFRVPAGYRPALPRSRGGFDFTRPDTLKNRLLS